MMNFLTFLAAVVTPEVRFYFEASDGKATFPQGVVVFWDEDGAYAVDARNADRIQTTTTAP